MTKSLDPFRFLLIALSGWMMNQQQLQLIDYLREENRVLREQLAQKRLRFNDDQRRRLAAKAKGLGSKLLREVAPKVTSETLRTWRRRLIAQKYDGCGKPGCGRPIESGRRSRIWWCAWRKKTAVGVSATMEARTRRGLPRWVILFFMKLSTRKVEMAGRGSSPSGLWMNPIGRHLRDGVDGLLDGKRYLIHDHDRCLRPGS